MSNNLIGNIVDWFKAAKPEPTKKDICTQVGCHFEEVAEMVVSIHGCDVTNMTEMSSGYKSSKQINTGHNSLDLLDALCDQIVTATGVAYMMGFDIEGALKEVVRSNNSKMVDGNFIFDDNGKIAKPDSFSEPNLKPFLGDK